MTFERGQNGFRAALMNPGASPLVTGKKPRGDRSALSLTGKSVARTATRSSDTRAGDRHRLSEAGAIIRKGRRKYSVDLINISGGGAMVEGNFPAKLWQSVILILGDVGEVECAVRWIRDKRIGLEFAHETRIDCEPAILNETLRKVLIDSAPVEEEEDAVTAAPTLASSSEQGQSQDAPDARRNAQRHPLIWSGIIQFNHESLVARLRNISAEGAQIQSAAVYPIGSTVLLDLGNAGAIAATVRWACGDQAGLAFHAPFDIRLLSKVQPQVTGSGWVKPEYLANEDERTSPWASQWGRLTITELKRTLFR